jgi:hypothetical protein
MGQISHIIKFSYTLLLCLATAWVTLACEKNDLITIKKPTKVLEKAFPENYPSSNPKPNAVIAILNEGTTIKATKKEYGKDFLMYRVQLEDGRNGYIVYEKDAVEIAPEKK